MTITLEIPGGAVVSLEHLLLDQNGTLSDRGTLMHGVAERIGRVRERLSVHLLTADTFGTLDQLVAQLGIEGHRITDGEDKRAFAQRLGATRCLAIGNGNNDVAMLRAAALGVAVLGPEGTSVAAVQAADILCRSIVEALDLLLDERALIATIRP